MANQGYRKSGLTVCAALALATAAWAQQAAPPKAPEPAAKPPATAGEKPSAKPAENPDTVVLKVGGESYTKGDFDYLISNLNPQLQGVLARQGRKPLGDQYALMVLLSELAVQDHVDASADFKRHMAFQRVEALAQTEYQKLSNSIKVSSEEVNQYYSSHGSDFERAQVREFVIRKKAEGATGDAQGLSPVDAHARADAIRKALTAGTDPKQVAEKFRSPNDVMIDAEPRSIRHGQLIPTLDKAAFELKDGQLSEPYETPQAVAFLQVVGHDRAGLKEVTEEIQNALHEQKLKAAVEDLKSKAPIWMDEEYFKSPAQFAPAPAPEPQH